MVARIAQTNEKSKMKRGEERKPRRKLSIDSEAYPEDGKYQIYLEYFHGYVGNFAQPHMIEVESNESTCAVGTESREPRFVCIA